MGILFALVTACLWAGYNIFVRRGLQGLGSGPGYVVTLAVGVLSNLLYLFLPLPGRGAGALGPMALVWFVLAGFSTTLLGRWVYFQSIETLGPSRASAWKNSAPLWTLALGAIFLGEPLGLVKLAGTAAVMAGIYSLSRETTQSLGPKVSPAELRRGILLSASSAVVFSAGMLFRKAGLTLSPDAAAGALVGSASALALYLPFAVSKGEVKALLRKTGPGVTAFFMAGLFSSLAQLTTFLSLRVTATAVTHVVASLEPLFTMMLSAALLQRQEVLSVRLAGSAALIGLGVVIIAGG